MSRRFAPVPKVTGGPIVSPVARRSVPKVTSGPIVSPVEEEPQIVITAPKGMSDEEKQIVKDRISDILLLITKDKEIGDTLLNAKYINEWYKAFTHFSRDYGNNYEVYEKIGDIVMRLCFVQLLINSGIIDDKIISELEHAYLTKMYQSKMSQEIGLTNIVIYDSLLYDINVHIAEDLIESLFGVLYIIGNRSFYEERDVSGFGLILCEHLMGILMKDKLNMEKSKGRPQSILKELLDKLGSRVVIGNMFDITPRESDVLMTFKPTIPLKELVRDIFNVELPDSIGRVTGKNTKSLTPVLSIQVLKEFASVGITTENVDIIMFNKLFNGVDVDSILKNEVAKHGCISYTFHIVKHTDSTYGIILLGLEDEYGVKKKMLLGARGSDPRSTKKKLVETYLRRTFD